MNEFFNPEPMILAHRGDSARFPENTMPSFRSAVEMGVDLIETDVHLSADGEVVIWHDDTFERMSGNPLKISQMTWSEIQQVDAGLLFTVDNGRSFLFKGKNIHPVLLSDILKQFPSMRFNIDLKDTTFRLVEKYCAISKTLNCDNRVVTASFHHKTLLHFRKLHKEALTSCTSLEVLGLLLLYKTWLLKLPFRYKMRILQVPEYSGKLKILSSGFISDLHKRGFKVQVWTVNETSEMNRLLDMGVDGIFTDKPTLLMEVVKKRQIN